MKRHRKPPNAPPARSADLVRSRSALGTTTTLKTRMVGGWRKAVDELATAVARGEAPLVFLTTNDAVIGAAVRGKDGVRHVPGLIIEKNRPPHAAAARERPPCSRSQSAQAYALQQRDDIAAIAAHGRKPAREI